MVKKKRPAVRRPRRRPRPAKRAGAPDRGGIAEMVEEVGAHGETSPRLTGGDIDADWQRAYSTGEEAVGGSVATPDQDVVDELGRALGVEQPSDGEVWTSEEILRARDRHRWHLERDAAGQDEREDAQEEDAREEEAP